jgi:prepilin-type N-terminal cleavage/methylation domain-containing protein
MMKKLLNTKLKAMKNQKGLTLIELLVVIVILGIIAAIAIPMVMSNRDKAVENAVEQTNNVVKDAAARYHALEGSQADDIGDLLGEYLTGDEVKCPEGYAGVDTDLDEYCQVSTSNEE